MALLFMLLGRVSIIHIPFNCFYVPKLTIKLSAGQKIDHGCLLSLTIVVFKISLRGFWPRCRDSQ